MTRDQLEHAIRDACDVAGDNELLSLALRRYWLSIPMLHPN